MANTNKTTKGLTEAVVSNADRIEQLEQQMALAKKMTNSLAHETLKLALLWRRYLIERHPSAAREYTYTGDGADVNPFPQPPQARDTEPTITKLTAEVAALKGKLRRERDKRTKLLDALKVALPVLEQETEQREQSGNNEDAAPVRAAAEAVRAAISR